MLRRFMEQQDIIQQVDDDALEMSIPTTRQTRRIQSMTDQYRELYRI